MDESKYLRDFNVISVAGQSKSFAFMAIEAAKNGNFEEAEDYLKQADDALNEAHNVQFEMLQEEANGNPVDITIITVHGQDHLTGAILMKDLAQEFIDLYKEIHELKK